MEGLRDYIGNGVEGNSDGKTLKCKFYQPTGLCVEFDDEVYVVDYRTSCVKVFSSTRHTTEFLAAIGNLMRAFAIHDKKRSVWIEVIRRGYCYGDKMFRKYLNIH